MEEKHERNHNPEGITQQKVHIKVVPFWSAEDDTDNSFVEGESSEVKHVTIKLAKTNNYLHRMSERVVHHDPVGDSK